MTKQASRRIGFRIANIILAFVLCMSCLFVGETAQATEKKTVRVAFFPMDGYHVIDENGNYSGMDVEYLAAIEQYTNWDIQYVACDSWEIALKKLKKQEIDLVGSAQYTEARAQIYDYADIASGYTFGVIASNADCEVAYEDFQQMQDFTFGIVKNYVRQTEFLEYLANNGIDAPKVLEYDSSAELQAALENGEIDAYAHTFTEVKAGQRLLGRFAPRPFYYITYKGNTTLLDELNHAIVDVKMNHPELETELMNQYYYDKFDQAVLLTTEEKQYLEEKQVLRVGYLDNYYPFSYVEDGEFTGLTRELLESSLAITGIELEYICLEDRKAASKALVNGEIDFFAYSIERAGVLKAYGLKSICDYVEVPLVLVTEKNKSSENIQKLGTVDFLKEQARQYNGAEDMEIYTYADQQGCIDAVMNHEVDAILCNGYYAEHLMRTNIKYNNIQIKTVVNLYYSLSIAVDEDEVILTDILEKTIGEIDSKMINEYTLKEVTYPFASIIDFTRDHIFSVIAVGMLIMGTIIFVAMRMVANSKKIQKLMYKDARMDVWNLNYFAYRGETLILPQRKHGYAVVFVNLSNFRRFNMIHGWNAGERVLEVLVRLLIDAVNCETEICARSQGDRFVLLLNYKEEEELYARLAQLQEKIETQLKKISGDDIEVQLGVYLIPSKEINLRHAVNCASQALEFVDSKVGNNIKLYDANLQQMLKERHEREKRLDQVEIDRDFVAFYQPKVDIRDNKVVGAEALVRFKDPYDEGKIKAPYFFVPYYEQTGKITEIDMFVFETVCRFQRNRLDAGLSVVPISCNFSRTHFVNPGFARRVEEILQKYEVAKGLVEIEVTETLIMEELDQKMVKTTFDELKEKGIPLSIDDFGSGYSSLGIFEQIPASVVKMDRSFFLNKENPERQVKIMRGIVALAKDLEAKVVCEGVETQKDVQLMEEIGAHVAQGYYYSKPIPEDEFVAFLNKGHI